MRVQDMFGGYDSDICKVCGQTPCNCTHITESASANPGRRLIELFQMIYNNGGDDAVDYLLANSPIFADYYDRYEGQMQDIATEVGRRDLETMVSELEEVAENEGLLEGSKKIPASNKPVDPKDLVVSLKDVPVKKPRGYKQYDPAKEFPGVKVFQKQGVAEGFPTLWEVSYDYGPHMTKSVTVKARSEDEARAKVEKNAQQRGFSIMINSVEPVEQGVAEAFIAPALSAANANAEHRRQGAAGGGYRGRIDMPVQSREDYISAGRALKKAAAAAGQKIEYGMSNGVMSVFSDSMTADELDQFIDSVLNQGVVEGLDTNTFNDFHKWKEAVYALNADITQMGKAGQYTAIGSDGVIGKFDSRTNQGYINGQQGVAEGKDDLSQYSTERLQAYVKKVSGGGVPAFGSGAQLKRVEAELKRRQQGVAEDTLNEEAGYMVIRRLIAEFNEQMSGSPYYPMDYTSPGIRMWTRGDGARYKDPGYIYIDRDLKPEDQPKWHKAKAVEKFWKFLATKGARQVGDVSGEFGSDPQSPAVVLGKLIFVYNGRSISWGSTSRLKNSAIWRQKQQGVAEGLANAGETLRSQIIKLYKKGLEDYDIAFDLDIDEKIVADIIDAYDKKQQQGMAEGYDDEEHPIRDDGNEGRPGRQRYPGKLKAKGVAEDTNDTVSFEVDSENAYNHIMKKFGSVIDWDGDAMVAPRKYWGAIQELAYAAGGEAKEYGMEGIAEVSKKTLGSYVKRAHQDVVDRASSGSFQSGQAGDKYNKADVSGKEQRRAQGMDRAVKRLTKEDTEVNRLLRYAQAHYPGTDEQEAFMKYVFHALRHNKENDMTQNKQIGWLNHEVDSIEASLKKVQPAPLKDDTQLDELNFFKTAPAKPRQFKSRVGTEPGQQDLTYTKKGERYILHQEGEGFQLILNGQVVQTFNAPIRDIQVHLEKEGYFLVKAPMTPTKTSGLGGANWFKEGEEDEVDYNNEYQNMVQRMAKKAADQEAHRGPVDLADLARKLRSLGQKDQD